LNYTAGGIISKRLFRFGYYESSFKVPPGAGWHTSFWLMRVADNSPEPRQEIDICENDSVKLTDYGINQHQWAPLPALTRGGKHVKTPDLSAALHLWGCEYTAERIQYYFDGNLVHSFDATQIRHGDVSVWLTMVAANLGGTKAVDDKALPAYAEFDYVRVYEPLAGAGERKPSADLKR
jgi:beta-glucanase (GH16 family)